MAHQWQDLPGATPPPPRVVVCTFGTDDYLGSAALLRHTALDVAGADAVVVYEQKDVQGLFDQYPELLPGSRGYGWWAWKPWCILRTLDHTRPGDVVVYCDAAMMFERPLAEYVAAVKDVLLFPLGGAGAKGYTNERWTKRDAFAFMDRATDEHRGAHQLNAAIQLYRNTPRARAFAEECLRWCVQRKVVDDACAIANYPGFQEHRHDQSVLSLLAVGHPDVQLARDPTQWGADDPPDPLGLPWPLVGHHRQQRRPIKVAVITPTTGGRHLAACVASVQAQELPNVEHYVVIDGKEHESAARAALEPFLHRKPLHVVVLPKNVGAGGWNGHRCACATAAGPRCPRGRRRTTPGGSCAWSAPAPPRPCGAPTGFAVPRVPGRAGWPRRPCGPRRRAAGRRGA